jgi:hypothetical protein
MQLFPTFRARNHRHSTLLEGCRSLDAVRTLKTDAVCTAAYSTLSESSGKISHEVASLAMRFVENFTARISVVVVT